MNSGVTRLLLTALSMLLACVEARSALFIDTFDSDQHARVGKGSERSSFANAPEAVGRERDVTVGRLRGNGQVDVSTGSGEHGLLVLETAGRALGAARVVWDGFDRSSRIRRTGLGGFDLTQNGLNHQFIFSAASDLGAKITIRV